MKELNNASLRETLEQLPIPQLDAMLRAELEKEPPNEHAVRLILKVLREREADYPVETNAEIDQAWKEYEKKTIPKDSGISYRILKAAAVLVVVGALMFALPQEVKADSFFDRIAAWTESFFELFSPGERSSQKEYEFRTGHPGLQELYDTVTELGVTVPVVPMWIEEGYELVDCKVTETPVTTRVTTTFLSRDGELIFELNCYSQANSVEYHKNEPDAEQYESNGVIHNVFRNDEIWIVVWTTSNIECFLTIDCLEDDLYQILDSIYTMEG